ncbi:MAG: lysylphosphatidylglycerol synthase transmembrane domain-containing protein [Bilophila wadsworthia]
MRSGSSGDFHDRAPGSAGTGYAYAAGYPPLGAILFLIAISYLIVCKFIHKPIHIFGKEFAFPPFKIAVAQAVVAGADLVAAGACLYVLLPPDAHVSFLQFLPTYLMAMVAVVLTHVPGGAGVLEVVILHLTTASPQAVFAALLCFRVIYYLLPLLLAQSSSPSTKSASRPYRNPACCTTPGAGCGPSRPRSWRARCSASEPSCASTSSCPSAPNGSRRSGNGSPSASSSSPAWRRASPGSCCCSSRAAYSIGSAPPSGWPSPC